jgi:16S rRNA processing protein RimM
VVTTTAGAEVLIPFVEQIVPEVNVGEKYVLVTPPAGLFEVNTDESPEEQAAEEQAGDQGVPAAASSEETGARNPEGQGNA